MQKFIFQVHPYLYTLKLPHYILRGYMPFYNFILPFNFDNFVSYNFYNFNLKDLIGRDYLFFLKCLFIILTVLGLSGGTQDLRCSVHSSL